MFCLTNSFCSISVAAIFLKKTIFKNTRSSIYFVNYFWNAKEAEFVSTVVLYPSNVITQIISKILLWGRWSYLILLDPL